VLSLPVPSRLRAPLGLIPSGEQPTSWWVLGNENFRFYFCGSVVSDLGTWLQNTAQVLLAYRLAHSVFAVGLVTCAQFSSPLVLGPWAGVMADRFGGRRTLLGTQVVSALIAATLAGLQFTGHLNELGLVSGAILSGLAFAFALPARNVTVRRLVGGDEIAARAAFVMDAVSYNLGRAIAPLLSIAVVHWFGYGWAFAGNAVSFVVFTMILWRAGRFGAVERRQRSRVMDGFRIAAGDGRILVLLLMVAAVTVADDPVLVLGPALANHLGVSASWSGWFIAALGGGSVLGSLRRSKHRPNLRLAATALALLAGCMIFFVIAPVAWLSVVAALGAGITCLVANSAMRTLLSKSAGPASMAPVMAVWAIAWAGSKPLASLADGLLAGWIGVHWTGVVLALPALIPIAIVIFAPSLGHRLVGNRTRGGEAEAKAEPEPAAYPSAVVGSEVPVPVS
jgi:Transmembrane secretion effector